MWKHANNTGAKAKCVKSTEKSTNQGLTDESDEETAQTAYVHHRVSALHQYSRDTPRLEIEVRGRKSNFKLKALPDTGATRSIISLDLACKHNILFKSSAEKNICGR